MNRNMTSALLYTSILFVCFSQIAIPMVEIRSTSSVKLWDTPLTIKLKRFRLSKDEIMRLKALRSEVAQYVGTYATLEPFSRLVNRRPRKSTNKMKNPRSTIERQIPTKRFKLTANQIKQLLALQSDVAQYVRTYVSPPTFRPTQGGYSQKQRRHKYQIHRERPLTRSTKITSIKVYSDRKPYPGHLERRKVIYKHLVSVFSGDDEEKKTFLTNMDVPAKKDSTCYMEVITCFMQHCFYDHYYGFTGMKYIRSLLNRACLAEWLDDKKIIRVLRGCCQKRFKFKIFDLF